MQVAAVIIYWFDWNSLRQLVVMIGVRKLLDFIFTKYELKALDDLMPDSKKSKEFDDEEETGLVMNNENSE